MEYEYQRRAIQKGRTAQSCYGVQAGSALAKAEAFLGSGLALSRVRCNGPQHWRHCRAIRRDTGVHFALAEEARHSSPERFGSTRHQALGCFRQRQSDVESARGIESPLVGRCDAGAASVLHKPRVEVCVFSSVEARQRDVPALPTVQGRSAGYAVSHSSHRVVRGRRTARRYQQSRLAMRSLPSVRSFSEER